MIAQIRMYILTTRLFFLCVRCENFFDLTKGEAENMTQLSPRVSLSGLPNSATFGSVTSQQSNDGNSLKRKLATAVDQQQQPMTPKVQRLTGKIQEEESKQYCLYLP